MSSTTIEVAKYIHDLLYEYSSVIVPDLGAFSTRNKMASIDEDAQSITPPMKTVVFNERLKINDGILVKHIAKMEAIPPSLVEDALKKFAAQTNATLQAGEAVPMGNLGTLQYQADQGIEFYPTQDLNLSLNSFGLQTLNLPTIAATTPPSSDENIGAAGVGGTSELDLSFEEEEKDLPIEEEIPDIPSEKRTVSSVLAEKAQNLPPVPPPERRRRSGGGWFWLLPVLMLGLCLLLIMQLSGDKNDGNSNSNMAHNETNTQNTEESKGIWAYPPFSWFSGSENSGNNSGGELADNNNGNSSDDVSSNGNNASKEGTNATASEGNGDANNSDNNDNEDRETVETGGESSSGENNSGNSSSSTNDGSTSTNSGSDDTSSTAENTNTNSDSDGGGSDSDSGSSDTNTNTNDRTSNTNSGSGSAVTLTNTSALTGINVAEARPGEYTASNAPKGYYIIIGAFKSQANANKAIKKLKAKGHEASALKTSSGYYRVGIYGSTDGKTAKERYNAARTNENRKAWMLNFQ